MKRFFAALLVLVFIPGVSFADEPEPADSLWSSLVAWFDGLVTEVIGSEATEGDDSEDEETPSLWGTIDPIG